MRKRLVLDTNLIVRFLTQDHQSQALTATNLMESCDKGEVVLVILPVVFAEVIFVLESFYDRTRDKIATSLDKLLSSPGIELVDIEIYRNALSVYKSSKLHFVDAVVAAYARAHTLPVATFDKGLAKTADISVELE